MVNNSGGVAEMVVVSKVEITTFTVISILETTGSRWNQVKINEKKRTSSNDEILFKIVLLLRPLRDIVFSTVCWRLRCKNYFNIVYSSCQWFIHNYFVCVYNSTTFLSIISMWSGVNFMLLNRSCLFNGL